MDKLKEQLRELFNTTTKKVIGIIVAAVIAAGGIVAEVAVEEFLQKEVPVVEE